MLILESGRRSGFGSYRPLLWLPGMLTWHEDISGEVASRRVPSRRPVGIDRLHTPRTITITGIMDEHSPEAPPLPQQTLNYEGPDYAEAASMAASALNPSFYAAQLDPGTGQSGVMTRFARLHDLSLSARRCFITDSTQTYWGENMVLESWTVDKSSAQSPRITMHWKEVLVTTSRTAEVMVVREDMAAGRSGNPGTPPPKPSAEEEYYNALKAAQEKRLRDAQRHADDAIIEVLRQKNVPLDYVPGGDRYLPSIPLP